MTHLCPCFRGFGITAGSRRDDKACAALPVLHPLLPPLALCSCVHLSEGAQVGKVIAALWLAAGLMLPEGSPSNHLFSLGAGVIDRAPCLNIMENWESEIGALWAVTVSYGYSRACKILALPSNKGHGAKDNRPAHLRGPNPLAPPAGMWGLLAIQRGSTHTPTRPTPFSMRHLPFKSRPRFETENIKKQIQTYSLPKCENVRGET